MPLPLDVCNISSVPPQRSDVCSNDISAYCAAGAWSERKRCGGDGSGSWWCSTVPGNCRRHVVRPRCSPRRGRVRWNRRVRQRHRLCDVPPQRRGFKVRVHRSSSSAAAAASALLTPCISTHPLSLSPPTLCSCATSEALATQTGSWGCATLARWDDMAPPTWTLVDPRDPSKGFIMRMVRRSGDACGLAGSCGLGWKGLAPFKPIPMRCTSCADKQVRFYFLTHVTQLLSYVLTYLLVQSLLYSLSRSARARRSRTRTSATTRSGLPRLETASRAATLPRRVTLHSSTQGPGRAAAPRMAPSSRSPPQTAEGRGPRRWGRQSPLW